MGLGATSESGNIAELVPSVAVICAVVSVVTLEVATWKLPLDPLEIESVAGTMTLELFAEIETDVALLTAELSITWQVEGAGGITESGVQLSPVTVVVPLVIVTVFPNVVVVSVEPPVVTEPPVNPTAEEESVVVLDIVSATVATTPLAIVLVLIPYATQLEMPAVLLLHVTDFDAEFAAAPVDTEMELKSLGGYVRVHCTAPGCVVVEPNERFKLTTLPGLPEPEERLKLASCAIASVEPSVNNAANPRVFLTPLVHSSKSEPLS